MGLRSDKYKILIHVCMITTLGYKVSFVSLVSARVQFNEEFANFSFQLYSMYENHYIYMLYYVQ